jgi:hypothetical protein
VRSVAFATLIAFGVAACAAIAGLDAPEPASESDAGLPSRHDGAPDADTNVDSGPPTASFELVCNGVVVKRHNNCPRKRWEFDGCPLIGDAGRSLVLKNTGRYSIAYIARKNWPSTRTYTPSIATDAGGAELVGVIAAGANAEIAATYNGIILAIVGSVRPFAIEAGTAPLDDEGTIIWTKGELSGMKANKLDVAQITTNDGETRCWDILNPDRRHFD